MNTKRSVARIINAVQQMELTTAERAQVMEDVWTIRTLTYTAQVAAVARWRESLGLA